MTTTPSCRICGTRYHLITHPATQSFVCLRAACQRALATHRLRGYVHSCSTKPTDSGGSGEDRA